MHAAATEAADLARGIHPGERAAVGPHDPPREVRLQPAERLAGEDVEANGDERARLGVEQAVRRRDADQPVTAVAPGAAHRGDLGVLAEVVVDLVVACRDRAPQRVGVDESLARELVHPCGEPLERVGDDEVLAVPLERLDGGRGALARPAEHLPHVLVGEVGVLLRAGEGELLLDDALVEHEPRVVVAAAHDVPQGAEGVEPREEGRREAPALRVEPQRRRARQHPDAVVVPHGVPVAQPLRVVPHPVGVDDPAPGGLRDAEHPAVDVGGHARDHPGGRRPEPLRPGPAHEVVVPADAAARDDDGLGGDLEVAGLLTARRPAPRGRVGGSSRPRTPVTTPPVSTRASTRWRKARVTRPAPTASRTRRSNGSTSPGPVPHVRWKRGTELPCPSARPSPRSAQPTTGKSRWPCSCSQARSSPAAKWR